MPSASPARVLAASRRWYSGDVWWRCFFGFIARVGTSETPFRHFAKHGAQGSRDTFHGGPSPGTGGGNAKRKTQALRMSMASRAGRVLLLPRTCLPMTLKAKPKAKTLSVSAEHLIFGILALPRFLSPSRFPTRARPHPSTPARRRAFPFRVRFGCRRALRRSSRRPCEWSVKKRVVSWLALVQTPNGCPRR